ncbi:5067_t:CDS:1, partial [Gigaspora margarita]
MSQNFEPIETDQIAIRLIIIRLNHVLFYFGANFCPITITRIEEDENIINEF